MCYYCKIQQHFMKFHRIIKNPIIILDPINRRPNAKTDYLIAINYN